MRIIAGRWNSIPRSRAHVADLMQARFGLLPKITDGLSQEQMAAATMPGAAANSLRYLISELSQRSPRMLGYVPGGGPRNARGAGAPAEQWFLNTPHPSPRCLSEAMPLHPRSCVRVHRVQRTNGWARFSIIDGKKYTFAQEARGIGLTVG